MSVCFCQESTWLMPIIIRKQAAPQSPRMWLRMKYGQESTAASLPKKIMKWTMTMPMRANPRMTSMERIRWLGALLTAASLMR